ncbi:MAG: hypothetical protein CMC19_09425 [Flavobacteriaceae bacterium]|nr:hypothetical protein [Flavobacteriaceae bacterium]
MLPECDAESRIAAVVEEEVMCPGCRWPIRLDHCAYCQVCGILHCRMCIVIWQPRRKCYRCGLHGPDPEEVNSFLPPVSDRAVEGVAQVLRDESGTLTMYHMVKLNYLVRHCPKSPGSQGILVDGSMRYGCANDGEPVCVYLFAYKPWELIELIEYGCFLELRVRDCVTPVATKHFGKYVLKSDHTADSGAVCTHCEVKAMYIEKALARSFGTV